MPALLLGMLNKRAISLKYINKFQINLWSGLSKSGREFISYLNDLYSGTLGGEEPVHRTETSNLCCTVEC